MKIAIDGPSGAGKSTVAKLLAKKLNMVYLDTGAMYRAVALYAHNNNIPFTEEAVSGVLKDISVDIKYNRGGQRIYLNNADVSKEIRQHFMSKLASDISALPPVRLFLVDIQRLLASKNNSILDGRDIGTFVLPDADFKFYLTADINERAKRRQLELAAKGESNDILQIKQDIEKRDYNDMNRAFAPLKQAEDAVLVDSTNMTAEEVADYMVKLIKGK